MKFLFYFFLICMVISCKREIATNDKDVDSYIEAISVSGYEDGFHILYNTTHKIAEGHIKDSQKNGYWRFYKNQQLLAEGAYKNGVKSGYWKLFYINGNIKSEGHYKSGKPKDFWRHYSENGVILEKRY